MTLGSLVGMRQSSWADEEDEEEHDVHQQQRQQQAAEAQSEQAHTAHTAGDNRAPPPGKKGKEEERRV